MSNKKVLYVLSSLLVLVSGLSAAPMSGEMAERVVVGWLGQDACPMGMALNARIDYIDTYLDEQGEPVYHVVYLLPAGMVIVAGEDQVEPIIGFAAGGQYDPSPEDPLGALVESDVRGRVERTRADEPGQVMLSQGEGEDPELTHRQRNQQRWAMLLAAETEPVMLDEQEPEETEKSSSISDVWVAPFIQTRWSQSTVCGNLTYNLYTPSNYVCGCGATAFAQVLKYFEHPTTGIGVNSFNIEINGGAASRSTRGGNGAGGPYDWANMVNVPGCSTTAEQRQAIGALCYDAGISMHMNYTSSGSGSIMFYAKDRMLDTFDYDNAVKGYNGNSNIGAGLIGMLNPNLDAGLPVMLGIFGDGGHAILADGYGYNGSTMYHHLNMGWGGWDDAWYNLPTIDTTSYNFNSVDQTVYNIFVSGEGEIISGRVTDGNGDPVSGATVTAAKSGGGSYSDTTDSNGIYAVVNVPSNSSYTVSVTKNGYDFTSQTVTTGTSTDYANTSGNSWGNDFEGTEAPDPSIATSKSSYNRGESIVVTFADGPGLQHDWLGIFSEGAGNDSHLCWLYTDGTKGGTADITDGTVTFTSALTGLLTAGNYEVRYFTTSFEMLAGDGFTVSSTGPSLTTNKSSYTRGETITASFANVPGLKHDWIGIFTSGADNSSPLGWLYSDGTKTGTQGITADSVSFTATTLGLLDAGDYDVRMFAGGSRNGIASDSITITATAPTITASKESYNRGETLSFDFSNAPGQQKDWIGVFAAGTGANEHLYYLYTDGTKTGTPGTATGTVTMTASQTGMLTAGDYEVRLYAAYSAQLLASDTFTISATSPILSTDKTSYSPTESIVCSFSNAPGLKYDWIGLYQEGAGTYSYLDYLYTDNSKSGTAGQTSGSVTFSLNFLEPGNYAVRLHGNGSANVLATDTFTVSGGSPSVSTDQETYTPTDPIVVSFSNAPAHKYDWIGIYEAGAATISYLDYRFTDDTKTGTAGQVNGSVTFNLNWLAAGSYEVRLHVNGSGTMLASDTFTVSGGAPSVSTDKTSYTPGEAITVSFTNAPGYKYDWIGIFQEGDAPLSYQSYLYTDGTRGGTASIVNDSVTFTSNMLGALSPGNYETRMYCKGSTSLLATDTFTITGSLPSIAPNKSTYEPAEAILITVSNAPGNKYDWVGLFNVGDPASSHQDYRYTDGTRRGTAGITDNTVYFSPMTHGILSSGTFEVRFYVNGSSTLLDSETITISGSNPSVTTDKASYSVGEAIQVNFANASRLKYDWIGLFNSGDPVGSYIDWRRTDNTRGGTAGFDSGSVTFSGGLPGTGTYEARLYSDGGSFELDSYTFTVN